MNKLLTIALLLLHLPVFSIASETLSKMNGQNITTYFLPNEQANQIKLNDKSLREYYLLNKYEYFKVYRERNLNI